MFWFLLFVYFVGWCVFCMLAASFTENHNAGIGLATIVLGIAMVLFSAHLWYAFYTLMLLPWFTFLPAIPELNFWGIYIAYALMRAIAHTGKTIEVK